MKYLFLCVAFLSVFGKIIGTERQVGSDSGFFLDGTFLYLQAKEDGLEYGDKVDIFGVNGTPAFIAAKIHPKNPNFEWNPGFQVSLGYIFCKREAWDLVLSWTHYISDSKRSTSTSVDFPLERILPGWDPFLTGAFASHASAHWDLHYNILDVCLEKYFSVGNWFAVKPTVGLRGAWIDQKYRTKYLATQDGLNFFNSNLKARNDFSGLGVKAGTDLQWFLSKRWSILGNFALSLIYGTFELKQKVFGIIFPAPGVTIPEEFETKASEARIVPNLESKIGLQWQTFLSCHRYRISFGAFYNLFYWFHQNRLHNLSVFFNALTFDTYINEIRNSGDLQIHGGSLEARFEF